MRSLKWHPKRMIRIISGEAANNLGRIYNGVKRFKEARTYLEKALQASSEVNLQSIMKDSYGLLAKLDSVKDS